MLASLERKGHHSGHYLVDTSASPQRPTHGPTLVATCTTAHVESMHAGVTGEERPTLWTLFCGYKYLSSTAHALADICQLII